MIEELVRSEVITNYDVEDSIQMSVDAESLGFLIEAISSSLYRNGVEAVLREYTSNAIDSHVKAGQTRPVEITLPTSLNPTLTVRDYGVGLSWSDIKDMYSKLGASDKRGEASQIGGKGLGAKSALAISPQFTLIAVKDGRKEVVSITKNEENIPQFDSIERIATDEHNGVTIIVPVTEIEAMRTAAQDMFIATPLGSVIVDGQPIPHNVHNPEQFTRIGEWGWLAHHDTNHKFTSASSEIQGVRYEVTSEFDNETVSSLIGKERVFLSIPKPRVRIASSRDYLMTTKSNRAAVQYIAQRWLEKAREIVKDELESKPCSEALAYHHNLPKFLATGITHWRGIKIPNITTTPIFNSKLINKNAGLPFLHLVSKSFRTRYTSKAVMYKQDQVDGPTLNLDSPLPVVIYTLETGHPEELRIALRDLRDADRGAERDESYERVTTYLSTVTPAQLSEWLVDNVTFRDASELTEPAFNERKLQRQEAATRRKANHGSRAAAKKAEPNQYTRIYGKLSSSSARARFTTEHIMGEGLVDSTKVAYFHADKDAPNTLAGAVLRLADRSTHPGAYAKNAAQQVVEHLESEGWVIIQLRNIQKTEDTILVDVPHAVPLTDIIEALVIKMLADMEANSHLMSAEADQILLDASRYLTTAHIAGHIDGSKILDPVIRTLVINEATPLVALGKSLLDFREYSWRRADPTQAIDTIFGDDEPSKGRIKALHRLTRSGENSFRDIYPLVSEARYQLASKTPAQHALAYINSVYEQTLFTEK